MGNMASSWPKRNANLWFLLASCAQAGHPDFFTQPHSLSSNNSLLQLVQSAVINSYFFYISRRATCFRFVSGSRCDSRKLLHPPLIEQTLSTHCVLLAFVAFFSILRTSNYILLGVHGSPETEDFCFTFLDLKLSRSWWRLLVDACGHKADSLWTYQPGFLSLLQVWSLLIAQRTHPQTWERS